MAQKILILDDIPEMGELIRVTIQGTGPSDGIREVEVRVVQSVFDAEKAILRDRPDILLVDEVIPGESPLELLKLPALEAGAGRGPVRVILITAAYQADRPVPRGAEARWPKWGWKDIREVRARIAELLNRG